MDSKNPGHTLAFACNLAEDFLMVPGSSLNAPNTTVILQETLSPEYVKTIPRTFWAGWTTLGLFSFDTDAAFDGRDLYRIEKGHIRIYPYIAQQEARKRYGLRDDEIFLGAFDGRVYYWIKGQPRAVYVRAGNQIRRFQLGKRVTEPLGMARGDPKGDLALYTVMLPSGWFSTTPRTLGWVVLDLKDAE